jgi:uncharacterized membrane protein
VSFFMPSRRFLISWRIPAFILISLTAFSMARAQGAKQTVPQSAIPDSDADHVKERSEWFFRGRLVRGKPSAELRHRAYEAKLRMRAQQQAAAAQSRTPLAQGQASLTTGAWTPLGPVPLASDATGNGTQNYDQVSGRATAVVIDPADATGNTVYIGGAQGGVWKSTNAASSTANGVDWTPVSDDQATLSIGAIAIQPGNTNPTQTVILAATGEADNSADSYFGLGIMVSTNAGNTWTLISTADSGALSFSGLGGTRMAFSTASGQTSTVVSAMATTSEGVVDGAVTANTTRGLYTSLDAGQTWNYDALVDPGGATDATSATSVVYNATVGLFFAAVRYHGFYSSPDGVNWNRLAVQPGGAALSTTACPPQSTSNSYACPIYRAEITVVPGRNEMYVWYISLASNGSPVDEGMWQSLNGGASWISIPDATIANCGDIDGCGVQQGAYNLELLAVPNGVATDLYAGAVNLYKCGINSVNPTCATSPFINLTHVYGCDPIAAPSHVHPDQHALAYAIPSSGSDSGNELLYFANDGGIYRALNGFVGLSTGSCTGTNQFDDLNQDLGSMTQFVSFSQHPTDPNTLLGGTQDNGSPATSQATTNLGWGNVLGGDGGYNAIDPAIPSNWYASNPDIPPGGLGVQFCPSGVSCDDSGFNFVVTSSTVGGDDGAFYFPYILDPQSSTAMLVGTCRVWRGPRAGGAYTVLSPNFDTLGSGTCSGSEVNLVQALAAGGPTDQNGSSVIYATTSALGPLNGPLTTPAGGHVWVTTDASAGVPAFTDVTSNGPGGSNINPNQFPISGVAVAPSDLTGNTAYVTVMGFTGGAGHVWKTTNAGAAWTDFTANLPDSPANAVVVYPGMSQVYVATDVGVFGSATSSASWTELGPSSGPGQTGFLPNVAVTALGVFNSGGQQLLRASTYGRGVWQYNLVVVPDFELSVSNSPLTVSIGQTAVFNGLTSALNGYASSVTLTCTAGATAAPSTCTPAPSSLTPEINTPFTVTAGGAVGDYYFNVQGTGSDVNNTTHEVSAVLHVLSNSPDFMLSEATSFPTVNAGSSTTSGPISVTATTGFTGIVGLACSLISGSGSCSVNPVTVTSFPTTANVTVNATTLSAGSYQLLVQGTSGATTHTLLIPFNVGDYQLSGTQTLTVGLGAQGTGTLTITPSTYYSGNINATCNASSLPGATCTLNPGNPIIVSLGSTASLVATISVPSNATPGTYSININTQDATGMPSHTLTISLTAAQNFLVTSSTASQTVTAGQTSGAYNLTVQPVGTSFASPVTLSCSGGLPPGAQCLFNPSTVTPGTSSAPVAMTVSTGASSVLGSYSLTVTGTSLSQGLSHSVSEALVVSGDFLVATTQPFPAGVDAGTQVTGQVSVTPNYSGSVTASCNSSAIPGAQCAISPANPIAISANTAVTLTVTLNVPNYATPSPYSITLTVADSSGQPSHTLSLPLTVIQDFSVSSATASQTVIAGQTTAPYQLTIAPNPSGSSFSSAVVFSCTGLPADTQCLFSPSTPVTPGSSAVDLVMSISSGAATSAGTYPVTVTGTSGSLSHSAAVSLIVTSGAVSPELNLAVTQPFASNVDAGSQSTAQVSVTPNYSGSVNATCDASAMPGAQCTLTPANPVAISANAASTLTVSLNAPNNIPPAAYTINLTVADSSGQPSQTVQLPLTVITDFSISSATSTQTVAAGQTSGAYQLAIAPNPPGSSFNAAVTLSCTAGLPAGAQCIFDPSTPITPGSTAVDVVMNISTTTNADMRPRTNAGSSARIGAAPRTRTRTTPTTNAILTLYAPWLLLPGIVIGWSAAGARRGATRRQRRLGLFPSLMLASFVLCFSLSLPSCGGVSNGGGGGTTGTPVTYTVTVTGTSGVLSHSTQITLIVD